MNLFKSKKGTTAFLMLMFGITFFVLGLGLAPSLKDTTDHARNQTFDGVTCANATSYQDKAFCTQTDSFSPFYVGIILGIAGLVIGRIVT